MPEAAARRDGRGYETGAQLLQRILETRRSQWKGKGKYKEPAAPDATNLPELPEGWVWASVEQLGDVGTGATPLRSRRDYYEGGKIPWVTSGALNEEFVSAANEYITDLAVEETNAKVFPAHTLLVAMYGEGKTRGKVSELLIDAATNQACAAIVMEGLSERAREFTKLFFLKNYDDIRRLSSGGVQPNLNLSHIKATAIPFPPLAEQHSIIAEIDRRLSLVREVEAQVDANYTRAERLRQSILKTAFSADLVACHG
ncbi:MAG: restriction endonuclease subunit S [Betaproteobacteria bacterium]|nr:restriction endonuclease subunit S [Betaproteobacteria bacterium]